MACGIVIPMLFVSSFGTCSGLGPCSHACVAVDMVLVMTIGCAIEANGVLISSESSVVNIVFGSELAVVSEPLLTVVGSLVCGSACSIPIGSVLFNGLRSSTMAMVGDAVR